MHLYAKKSRFFRFFFTTFFSRPQKKIEKNAIFLRIGKKTTKRVQFALGLLAIGVNLRVYLSTVTAKKKRVEETEYVQGPVHWIVLVDHKRKNR